MRHRKQHIKKHHAAHHHKTAAKGKHHTGAVHGGHHKLHAPGGGTKYGAAIPGGLGPEGGGLIHAGHRHKVAGMTIAVHVHKGKKTIHYSRARRPRTGTHHATHHTGHKAVVADHTIYNPAAWMGVNSGPPHLPTPPGIQTSATRIP